MESSRIWPWPRGSSRPVDDVLGLGLGFQVLGLGLGLGLPVLGLGLGLSVLGLGSCP